MSSEFERRCQNCANSIKGINEEPCIKCSHIYEDQWKPISSLMVINSAKLIKKMCTEYGCGHCPFHKPEVEPTCSLAPKDDNNIPSTWEV